MNLVGERNLKYSNIDNCKDSKSYFYLNTNCFNEVAVYKKDIDVCLEISSFIEDAAGNRNYADMRGEVNASLISSQKIEECRLYWYKNAPKTTDDFDLCYSAGVYRDRCFISIARNLKDVSVCDIINTTESTSNWIGSYRNLCIMEVGVVINDPSVCNKIMNVTHREGCISTVTNFPCKDYKDREECVKRVL